MEYDIVKTKDTFENIEYYKENPVEFCEKFLGIKMNHFQKRLLKSLCNAYKNNKKYYFIRSRQYNLNHIIELYEQFLYNDYLATKNENEENNSVKVDFQNGD